MSPSLANSSTWLTPPHPSPGVHGTPESTFSHEGRREGVCPNRIGCQQNRPDRVDQRVSFVSACVAGEILKRAGLVAERRKRRRTPPVDVRHRVRIAPYRLNPMPVSRALSVQPAGWCRSRAGRRAGRSPPSPGRSARARPSAASAAAGLGFRSPPCSY